ncbi:hypothetical protein O3Q52_05080 [Streptomyces sp. ActVer]|nr:hypothetical protein [Streptomyces sp. ActVer]MCZ4507592.1 hypothetical protein [Streptomyces sp. ActVer]
MAGRHGRTTSGHPVSKAVTPVTISDDVLGTITDDVTQCGTS